MAALILVVDDERNIVQLVELYLSREGFRVESAANGRVALDKAKALKPDLVVLDLMLPEVDGLEVCRQLRKESDVPIIMLTARDDDVDKVVGLELGADDYLTKPFNPRELVARVKAVLRRTEGRQRPNRVIRFADLTIDQDRHVVQPRLDQAGGVSAQQRRQAERRHQQADRHHQRKGQRQSRPKRQDGVPGPESRPPLADCWPGLGTSL